ncbi:micro-fibrillar-associated protein, putative [Plasmodium gallinaceum]|uniref:Micro-fibrillar-associated protein, putative n=1 Tax=Plasmodium gallinaceum TaxID=5849 RepID=A0A1J1GRP4_PLAGA|nr:micro-fibrillar-associated protein, putative [Plasmodium gallinaceum]CRG94964.1 micro-fibrillar-associated protein, putative [Plasmodium gallinaceum]
MSTVNELLNYFVVNDDNELIKKEKNQREKTIIKRYFPGKKPHYAKNVNDNEDDDEDEVDEHDEVFNEQIKNIEENVNNHEKNNLVIQPYKINNESDNRYIRLKNKNINGDEKERIKRRIREVQIIDYEESSKEKDILKENFEENSKADKNIPIRNNEEKEKEKEENEEEEEEEDEEEDEEEEEEDEDEEDEEDIDDSYLKNEGNDNDIIMKHEFVSKNHRKTLIERKTEEEEEKQRIKDINEEKELIEIEKKESAIKETLNQEMMEEKLRNKENNVFSSEEDFEEDEKDEELNEKEYELWKIRHLKRLKRDEMDRKKYEILKMEVKKRRKMTDKEIIEENKKLPHKEKKKKRKMLFMQKYYHRGGFYQDLFEEGKEEIYLRDYNEPVYEDKIDKEKLPKVLQVRRGNFGKQGQTKYTHLLDNDTSRKDSLWQNNDLNFPFKKKKDLFERPTYRKN